jgi:hypothetical protein
MDIKKGLLPPLIQSTKQGRKIPGAFTPKTGLRHPVTVKEYYAV